MSKMKFSLVLAFLLLSSGAKADEGVVLLLTDGSTVGFAFDEKPVLVIGDSLFMKTASQEVAYPYSAIRRIVFGDVPLIPDAIERVSDAPKSNVSFRLGDGGIEVMGLQCGERVSVYSMNGTLIGTSAASANDSSVSFSLGRDGGVYIVRTSSGKTFKFITK